MRLSAVVAFSLVTAAPTLAQSTDSVAQDRRAHVSAVRAAIAGKEQQPAESVFRNIQILRGLRAELIPTIMDQGFSRSLGVGCAHCHTTSDWSKPDSAAFAITREMYRMTRQIQGELLPAIGELRGRNPQVTCSTCHRGMKKPATTVP